MNYSWVNFDNSYRISKHISDSLVATTHHTKIIKEEFEKQIEALKKNKQDAMWQYFVLRRLVALFKDAHTQIVKPIENDVVLPFFALLYGGHSIIIQPEREYKELVGKELIAINGMKINTIFEKLFPIISYDKKEWAYLQAYYESRLFSNLRYIGAIKKMVLLMLNTKI